jgi:hypothetical protein
MVMEAAVVMMAMMMEAMMVMAMMMGAVVVMAVVTMTLAVGRTSKHENAAIAEKGGPQPDS